MATFPYPAQYPDGTPYAVIPMGSTVVNVSSSSALTTALSNASAGTRIVLANGTYSGSFQVTGKNGTSSAGISIEAANIGGAVFASGSTFSVSNSSYVTLRGLTFPYELSSGNLTQFRGTSHHCRITRCRFGPTSIGSPGTSKAPFVYMGDNVQHIRIDHCEFRNKANPGNTILGDGNFDTFQVVRYIRIDHNWFHSIKPEVNNEKEPVRLGVSTMSKTNSFSVIERNRFEDCICEPEIISAKAGRIRITGNTFWRNIGGPVYRHGTDGVMSDNYVIDDVVGSGGGGPAANAVIVSPSGNDSTGTGSANAPFRTFARALSSTSAGTTIYARAGTYNEKIVVNKSGSPGNPITISSYPGERAEVVGGTTTSFYNQGIIMLMGVSHVIVQDMTFRDIGGDGTGVVVQNCTNVTLKGNTVYNIVHAGIDVSGNNITVDGNEVYNACLINGPGSTAGGGWPPALTTKRLTTGASSSNIDIINNYVHDSWGEGIDAWFLNGGTVSNNRAINNYSVNLYADESRDLTITNNFMQSTNDTHNTHQGDRRPTALAVASETGAVRPTNLIINGNTDGGGHSDGIVWHNNGVFQITQSPSPQSMPGS